MAVRQKSPVKGYTRVRRGKVEFVDPHLRETEAAPPKPEPPPEVGPEANKTSGERDRVLWDAWHAGGRKQKDLIPLLKSVEKLVKSRSRIWYTREVPDSVVDAEFWKHTMKGLETFKPEAGVKVSTWLVSSMRGAQRLVGKNQNTGRIPEKRIYRIRDFERAQMALAEMGIPYTDDAMSQHIGWPVAEVARMSAEMRKDLRRHGFEEDPEERMTAEEVEVANFVRPELTDDEKAVYDLYFKEKVTSSSEIGKRLKWPVYKVSKVRKRIGEKIERWLK